MKNESEYFFNSIKPICNICNKDVDNLFIEHDFARDCIVLRVECHGEGELMWMDKDDLIDCVKFCKGIAFNKKCIDQQKLLGN